MPNGCSTPARTSSAALNTPPPGPPSRNSVAAAEAGDGTLQLRIADARLLVASQPQGDLEHDVTPSVRALEPAIPIAEGAVLRGERPALERGAIEAIDAHQRLGD